jgi:hypothetical protein
MELIPATLPEERMILFLQFVQSPCHTCLISDNIFNYCDILEGQRMSLSSPSTDLKDILDSRKRVIAFHTAVTALLIYQHSFGWNWDFTVYSMIGDYLFHDGIYMEWYRAPVAPAIMGLLQFVMARALAEYAFILITSLLFLHASFRFCDSYDIDIAIFHPLLLSPFIILHATMTGTEMLSLAFLILFFADLQRSRSGFWLGMAAMTRYTHLILAPFLLLQRDVKTYLRSGLLAAIPVTAWLGYNLLAMGDPFTSIANAYALNVAFRSFSQPPDPVHLFQMTGFALPVILFYLVQRRGAADLLRDRSAWLFLGVAGITLYSYLTTPVKPARYLYNLALPAAFIATQAWERLDLPQVLVPLLMLLTIIGGSYTVTTMTDALEDPERYRDAASRVADCQAVSDVWPLLAYTGIPTEPISSTERTREQIEEGYRIVLFKGTGGDFLQSHGSIPGFPVLLNTTSIVILGDESVCKPRETMDKTYFQLRAERLGKPGHRPCSFLLGRFCPYGPPHRRAGG